MTNVAFLPDGSSVSVTGKVAEIRDEHQRVIVRYEGGRAEIVAPTGDLRIAAPQGKLLLGARDGIELVAGADATSTADTTLRLTPTATSLSTGCFSARAEQARLAMGTATVFARQLHTTAVRVSHTVEHWELRATRMVERTRDLLREVEELAQERIGRLRLQVRETATLLSRRTVIRSTDDTAIDGRRVLLG